MVSLYRTLVIWGILLLQPSVGKPARYAVVPSETTYDHRMLQVDALFVEDIPEECPAITTCSVVCVANATSCPTNCTEGLQLCSTGTCAVDCTAASGSNPCECEELNVACPQVVDSFPSCQDQFQEFYDDNKQCLVEQAGKVPLVSFVGPWFLTFYVFYGVLGASVVLWCYVNQKLFPIATSTIPMQAATKSTTEAWTQTGYKINFVGSLLDTLVEFSFLVVQLLLLTTTLHYYIQQEAVDRWHTVFKDDTQALKAFAIVWMVGFLWCMAFRYPSTGVRSLFMRRCDIREATHVAVVAPFTSIKVKATNTKLASIVSMVWTPIDLVLRAIFSFPYDCPGFETVFCEVDFDRKTETRSILHRMRRYVYEQESNGYIPCIMSVGTTFGDLLDQIGGLGEEEADERRGRQGPNVIPLDKPTIYESLTKEFSKTYYIYQNFSVWVFANFWLFYLAIVYTVYRILGAFVVVYFQHKNDCLLYQLSHVDGTVEILRGEKYAHVHVEDIVPGDVVVLKPGIVHCDMVILKGFRVLVDESSLTGESTPLLKMEVDPSMHDKTYNASQHKGCTVSAGTEILELDDNEKTLALVMKTGSFTSKGELLTDVLSYRQQNFKFDDEVNVILYVLVVEAVVMISLVFSFLSTNWVYSWFFGAHVLVSVLPPLLPTVFIVSMCVSAKRLQMKRISCPHPEAILLAGTVDATFFDKTGTLTQFGLEFVSFDGSASGDRIRIGMAVCHTLTTTATGEVVGNQVDLTSFKASGAALTHEKGVAPKVILDGEVYTILKRFEFDNTRATQSVIVEGSDEKRQIYVKGSPEVIKELCMESSLADTFDNTVHDSASSGVYQIAIAYRSYNLEMELSEVRREDVEGCLTFGGFINFRNPIRDDASSVVQELEDSEMSTAMITGDNTLTGIFIARESYMIKANRVVIMGRTNESNEVEWYDVDGGTKVDSPSPSLLDLPENDIDLAITGDAWNLLCANNPQYVEAIMKRIRVFGRCKPADKVSVVALFVEHGYTTLMCGDGQNDCGCLKTAHVGVALSNAEASLVAPFTSIDKTLTAVVEVVREGRCALASSLSAYSYYIIYGQTETILRVILAFFSAYFSEWCWVFLNGIWSISLAFSIPLSKAADRLTSRRPTDSLLGPETLSSVCGILAWNFLFLVLALVLLFQQDWFQCRKWTNDDMSSPIGIGDNYETSVIFIVGGYQYIASAIVLNFGYTYRQKGYRNYIFVVLAFTWSVFFFFFTIQPSSFSCIWRVNCNNENAVRSVTRSEPDPIQNPFGTTVMPVIFRWYLVIIMFVNFVAIALWHIYFVNGYQASRRELLELRKRNELLKQPREQSTAS